MSDVKKKWWFIEETLLNKFKDLVRPARKGPRQLTSGIIAVLSEMLEAGVRKTYMQPDDHVEGACMWKGCTEQATWELPKGIRFCNFHRSQVLSSGRVDVELPA